MKKILALTAKNKRKFLLALIILFPFSYGAAVAFLITSDAYSVAKEYVYNSKELNDEFGDIQQVGMNIIRMGGLSYQRDSARAHYYLNIYANQNQRMVHVWLEKKNDDEWTILKHKIMN